MNFRNTNIGRMKGKGARAEPDWTHIKMNLVMVTPILIKSAGGSTYLGDTPQWERLNI